MPAKAGRKRADDECSHAVAEGNEEITLALDELTRNGMRPMIAATLRTEVDEYVERFSDEVDEDGTVSWSATAAHGSAG